MIEVERIQNVDLDYLTYLLSTSAHDEEIFRTADEIRRRYVGEEIHLRAIIEFSNICTQNCLYCGLRAGNNNIERYRMPLESIIERAELISKLGIKTVVLQSGEDPYYTTERVTQLITEIRKFNLAITLSIGERKFEEYKIWKQA
ncbi:MAG TPA: radical SAM protein, partial [Fervidobacterium sp.]|nr:radical SAM protein [Fervidobacterium sp.]